MARGGVRGSGGHPDGGRDCIGGFGGHRSQPTFGHRRNDGGVAQLPEVPLPWHDLSHADDRRNVLLWVPLRGTQFLCWVPLRGTQCDRLS
jgi:hypothetical protein